MLAVMAAEHPGKTLPPHQPSSGDADAVACGPGDGASGGHWWSAGRCFAFAHTQLIVTSGHGNVNRMGSQSSGRECVAERYQLFSLATGVLNLTRQRSRAPQRAALIERTVKIETIGLWQRMLPVKMFINTRSDCSSDSCFIFNVSVSKTSAPKWSLFSLLLRQNPEHADVRTEES